MSLLGKAYRKIGEMKFRKRYAGYNPEPRKFNNFISDSFDIAVILPSDEKAFHDAFNIARYLKIHKKNVTLILPEHFVNLIHNKEDYFFIPVSEIRSDKFGLPDENLLLKLTERKFDVLFDLSVNDSLFISYIALTINADYKIALFSKSAEKIYNFSFGKNSENNFENSFENLLNSIRMF